MSNILDELAPLTIKQLSYLHRIARFDMRKPNRPAMVMVTVNGKASFMGQRRYRAHLRRQMPMPSWQVKKHGDRWCVPYADPRGGFAQGFGRTRGEALWDARHSHAKAWSKKQKAQVVRWLRLTGLIAEDMRETDRRFIHGTGTLKGTPRGIANWKPSRAERIFGELGGDYPLVGKARLDAEADGDRSGVHPVPVPPTL